MRQAYSGPTGSKQGETSEPDVRDSSSTADGLAGDRVIGKDRRKVTRLAKRTTLQEQPVVMGYVSSAVEILSPSIPRNQTEELLGTFGPFGRRTDER
jgi:hypothetical protein